MRNRNGFTLIELLVVITIIAVLAGLLIPGIGKALKQAKTNRALSEMQHLSTVIIQVYSEVGYYVRLEDLARNVTTTEPTPSANVRRWLTADYSTNGRSDGDISIVNTLDYTMGGDLNVLSMWAGPYTTYKNSVTSFPTSTPATAGSRSLDPWGTMGNLDANTHQYRMFWINKATAPVATQLLVPAGANGAMVIISAGGNGTYDCNIGTSDSKKFPNTAVEASFNTFNPSNNKGDDVYYIFNAGIQ